MPEFQCRTAETEPGDGQVPPGGRHVGARLAHIHQPDLAASLECATTGLVVQLAFARLDPKQVSARFLEGLVMVRLGYPPRADGKQMPQHPPTHRCRLDKNQIAAWTEELGHWTSYSTRCRDLSTGSFS